MLHWSAGLYKNKNNTCINSVGSRYYRNFHLVITFKHTGSHNTSSPVLPGLRAARTRKTRGQGSTRLQWSYQHHKDLSLPSQSLGHWSFTCNLLQNFVTGWITSLSLDDFGYLTNIYQYKSAYISLSRGNEYPNFASVFKPGFLIETLPVIRKKLRYFWCF